MHFQPLFCYLSQYSLDHITLFIVIQAAPLCRSYQQICTTIRPSVEARCNHITYIKQVSKLLVPLLTTRLKTELSLFVRGCCYLS